MNSAEDAINLSNRETDAGSHTMDSTAEPTMTTTTMATVATTYKPELAPAPSSPTTLPEEPAMEEQPLMNQPESAEPSGSGDDMMTKVFQFLSTATPETLAGVGVGLAAVTYFLLGQLGLLLIGAFAGVTAFISWESKNPQVSQSIKGEKGIEVLTRILDLKEDMRRNNADTSLAKEGDEGTDLKGFEDFQPETRDALNNLVDAIIRDYVKWWYSPIVPMDQTFPLACRKVLASFLISVSNRLSRKRPADTFLDFLTNSSSIVIVFFSELSTALTEEPPNDTRSVTDSVSSYLASNPDSNLANLLNQKQQAAKFRNVADDLLGFLDRSTYGCDPARVFLREILAGVILEMTLKSCSKPEWINGWIVYLLEAGEPDFNQAIDVGMQTGPDPSKGSTEVDSKSGSNSVDVDKSQRKESMSNHRKRLSKADEEMENALEEMKKLNQMIADEDARRRKESAAGVEQTGESKSAAEASSRLADAMKRNADTLDMQPNVGSDTTIPKSPGPLSPTSKQILPSDVSGDESSAKTGSTQGPLTPGSSEMEAVSHPSSPLKEEITAQFTNFDQLVPPAQDEPEPEAEPVRNSPQPLTLHHATITIHDDGMSDAKNRIKNRPAWDYLIQVEPANPQHPGWMIVRKYADFEQLHEILARIAKISGATAFTEQHGSLPAWRVHTKVSLRGELERYCRDACQNKSLATSEGMKRFLEKDILHTRAQSKSGFEAFETMGKNVFGVLTSAPKGVADGGKAVVGGVTGVLGNLGLGSRKNTSSSLKQLPQQQQSDTDNSTPAPNTLTKRHSVPLPSPIRHDSGLSVINNGLISRDSMDSQRSSVISTQPAKIPPMERRPSYNSQHEGADGTAGDSTGLRPDRWDMASPTSAMSSRNHSRASSVAPVRSPSSTSLSGLKLPPPPTEIPDDYGMPRTATKPTPLQEGNAAAAAATATANPSPSNTASANGFGRPPKRQPRTFSPLSEQETSVAVELLFAVITELYTLSPSAWNIRRTLLAAAKSFLLRPGNPSLESIRLMIQETVLDSAASDEGMAAQLRKLRENSVPTEEELAAWPPEMSEEDKAKLRVKARKLLIQSGVPAALSGVMGQQATSEALGRVFDCLQVEEVARGLLFGIMLQAVRAITH
ncbi:hypothetical protein MCOR25_002370 [Pyricularia grisea]|uniref:PXA domain-containing protein n=1 Tax=Pyricularia grisea TaxID=148305 RepID=A0A6P8AW45_PYRGI|nr:uncharacterized protein PgNI_08526 [Pyricularia grisea]KAI6377848.1 hypothetical protein MCOR25_002370 [Pyricularia grisea]TLD06461.1 hypothetical protein PgNI_08526 [Pyricularia grisea]